MKQKKLKTLRISAVTADHDINIMLKKARRFLEKKHQVRIQITYKRRRMFHKAEDEGPAKMRELVSTLSDCGKPGKIKVQQGDVSVVLNPIS